MISSLLRVSYICMEDCAYTGLLTISNSKQLRSTQIIMPMSWCISARQMELPTSFSLHASSPYSTSKFSIKQNSGQSQLGTTSHGCDGSSMAATGLLAGLGKLSVYRTCISSPPKIQMRLGSSTLNISFAALILYHAMLSDKHRLSWIYPPCAKMLMMTWITRLTTLACKPEC